MPSHRDVVLATPLTDRAQRVLLLGSGELGKEVAIELQRLGAEVIAVDRYDNAPAMQVAHRSHTIDMTDPGDLLSVLEAEKPAVIVPEIEAIATDVLVHLEKTLPWQVRVIPTARATSLTMNREGIRRLAAEDLGLPTSAYEFVDDESQLREAISGLGQPCVIKPVMSSSGKGQSVISDPSQIAAAWDYAQSGGRSAATAGHAVRCIVEAFVEFDTEITLLTVRGDDSTRFFDPIYHRQVAGDYAESWQYPHGEDLLPPETLRQAQSVAREVTDALGGRGVFGVELFIAGDQVIFSEVSPRPHDTGLVTLVSSDISEFAAHARSVLGLPGWSGSSDSLSAANRLPGAAASWPLKANGEGIPEFAGLTDAYAVDPSIQVRLFGKPRVVGERRVGVVLARGATTEEARRHVSVAAERIQITLHQDASPISE